MIKKGFISRICFAALPLILIAITSCKKDTPELTVEQLKDLTIAPVLTYPANNATSIPTSFTFKWDASTWSDGKNHGSFSYKILYGTANPPEIKDSLTEGINEYSVNGLELNKKYYCKVIALHDGIVFKESKIISFTTETGFPPTVPVLTFPINAATNTSIKPHITWSASNDPEGKAVTYDVFLDKSTNPQTRILENQTSINIIVSNALEGETQYFWKVVAKDADGNEIISEIRNFTTGAFVLIPDANFRAYLKTNFPNAFQGDTLLYKHSDITSYNGKIDVHEKNIYSLKGIEYFTAITDLNCDKNSLTTLNLGKNTALKKISYILNGYPNDIVSSIDLSKNIALTKLDVSDSKLSSFDIKNNILLDTLVCKGCQLNSIDVSNNTAFIFFDCRFNQLTSLNVSKNALLENFSCDRNNLTSIDISNNSLLTYFSCGENSNITSLDLSNNTKLELLSFRYNKLTTIDLSKNIDLTGLWVEWNELSLLDLSKNTKINNLVCEHNLLTSLDISSQTIWFQLTIGAGDNPGYNSPNINPLTMLKVNDAVKNHQQFKDGKTKLPNMTIEVYNSGFKTCSNYDPNIGSCITP